MPALPVVTALARGIERASLALPPAAADALGSYLTLLARWNRRINLTAFDLDTPSDEAIDRLVVEPVVAARFVSPEDRELVDIGSGGGSPAVPLAICCPWVRVTMVEARGRKASFLREVIRELALQATAEERRFDEAVRTWPTDRPVDVVTCRAVRAEAGLWKAIEGLLRPRGRAIWFGHITDSPQGQLDIVDSMMFGSTELNVFRKSG